MKKRVICTLLIFLFIVLFTGCKNNSKLNFVSIEKDNILVEKALSYFKYSVNSKKELIEKIFDNNESIIKTDDLSNEEKMLLVLEEFDRLNDGCIYSQIGRLCSFEKSNIENLVFENTNFISDYMKPRKYYNIRGIDLMYNEKIFQAQGHITENEDNKIAYFYVTEAKQSDKELIIYFTLSYLDFNCNSDSLDTEEVLYYKNINDDDYILKRKINVQSENFGTLDENIFNSFKYTLKIDNEKIYFKSIEKM